MTKRATNDKEKYMDLQKQIANPLVFVKICILFFLLALNRCYATGKINHLSLSLLINFDGILIRNNQ